MPGETKLTFSRNSSLWSLQPTLACAIATAGAVHCSPSPLTMTRTQMDPTHTLASRQEPAPIPTLSEITPRASAAPTGLSLEGVVETVSVSESSASFEVAGPVQPATPPGPPALGLGHISPSVHSHSPPALEADILGLAGLSFSSPEVRLPSPTDPQMQALAHDVAPFHI